MVACKTVVSRQSYKTIHDCQNQPLSQTCKPEAPIFRRQMQDRSMTAISKLRPAWSVSELEAIQDSIVRPCLVKLLKKAGKLLVV